MALSVPATERQSKVKILGTANGIHIANANAGDQVKVYGMDGSLVHTQNLGGNHADINLKPDTLYIIKVADKVVKVKL